jgi:hypothetical protein
MGKHIQHYLAFEQKKNYFCQFLSNMNFFNVDPKIHVEMNRLKTIATWIPLIHQLKNLHNFHVIIQGLNIISL